MKKTIAKLVLSAAITALLYSVPYIAGYQFTRGAEDAKYHRGLGGNGNLVQGLGRIYLGL